MAEKAEDVWADGPFGAPFNPDKARIRAWGKWIEQSIDAFTANGGLIYTSRAQLVSDLSPDNHSQAWVMGDPTTAYNGIYMKTGASGAGSWSRIGDLPYSFNVASDVGSGTPNAIQATTSVPVSSAQIIILSIYENNTGSPVSISFNGGAAYTIKDFLGRDLSANELQGGSVITGVISGTTFRLLYDQKYPYAKAINSGAGTANAIVASIPVGVDFTDSNILIGLPITATTTAAPVTVAFNGNAPLTVKTNSGADPVVGGLIAGMVLLGFVSGSSFRLISDQASAAVLAAAEASAEAASDYADFARNNWVAIGPFTGTGAQGDYLLTIDPGSANNMFPIVGGVAQLVTTAAYSLVHSGGNAYIRINVPLGVVFEVRVSNAVAINVPADGSVDNTKIADGAISAAKLATGSISTSKIADGAVSTDKIASSSIDSSKIIDASITTADLANKAVTYGKFQDVTATARVLGRKSAGAGSVEEMSLSDMQAFLGLSSGTWTPTVSAFSGTVTTASASGTYVKRDGVCFFSLTVLVTTNGSGATQLNASLPFAARAGVASVVSGREVSVNGKQVAGTIDGGSSIVKITNSDNSYPGANGVQITVSGSYFI